ncbi:uncharacterized protein CTRU02_210294 [Colletotrichum truncatum]|uniref:Uncharacterized protein n=1 Tax=Colletotrichum truncatum TaxID=5467 RepID=A0ACC3YUS6_COLTU|nr:uncharacterized protein CTRU02_11507 [Colletotrichum truncatum]KAF6785882.1 hypothetical protein CTRU02_11507 [Colletotrichum truncatum]
MRVTSALASLLALLPVINGLEFTAPDTSRKLNLSAPITVEWLLQQNEGNPEFNEIDLWWHGEFARGGGSFGYAIVKNLSAPDPGKFVYTWDPASEVKALESVPNTLSADKVFYFEARRHPANSSAGSRTQSEKYAVEGYRLIGSSAGNSLKPYWSFALPGLFVAGALL